MKTLIRLIIIGFVGALSFKYISEKGFFVGESIDSVINLIKEKVSNHLENSNNSEEGEKVLLQRSAGSQIHFGNGIELNDSEHKKSMFGDNTAAVRVDAQFNQQLVDDIISIHSTHLKRIANAYEVELYAELDKYALAAPDSVATSLSSLVAHLIMPAKTDMEKARLLFRWIAENISYHDHGYNTGSYGDMSASGVLQSRTSVCSGFAEIFKAMGEEAGLEIVKISGYAKGYGHRQGQSLNRTNHAWNAIKIDGEWKLFDVTWAHGSGKTVNGRLQTVKEFKDIWFDNNPYNFIFSHLPEDSQWQLIDNRLSKTQFERLPYIHSSFFAMGFSGESILNEVLSGQLLDLPVVYSDSEHVKAISLPVSGNLHHSQPIRLELQSTAAFDMAVINNGKWTHFEKNDNTYSLTFQPQKGELKVSARFNSQNNSYSTLLAYRVR